MNVAQVAQSKVVTVNANTSLDAAIQLIYARGIRHLVVTEDETPTGMLSERDVLLHAFSDTGNHDAGDVPVGLIMTKPIVALPHHDDVTAAATTMLAKQLSAIPLITNGSLVGIVTRTDLLSCYSDPKSPVPSAACRQRPIVEHMSTNVRSIDPDDSTTTAIQMMLSEHIRHLPVVRNGKLFGIVSDRDVLRGGPRSESGVPTCVADLRTSQHFDIRSVMSKQPLFIEINATLANAAQQMETHRIGAIPVVDGIRLIGLLTDTDLLRGFISES